MSVQALFRVLFCAFVVTGLLLSGCDSSGSNSDSPEWTGDWKFVENEDGETPDPPIYITYTTDFAHTYVPTPKGCEVTRSNVIDIESEKVTFAVPGTGGTIPGSNVRTERLTVSEDTLILEVTRSNLSDTSAQEGDISKAVPVDEDPRSILGCEKSAVVNNTASVYRRLH